MHHIAFEMKDFTYIRTPVTARAAQMPINWGPVRRPRPRVAIYHRNFDDQNVEFYRELDQMKDEELGYSSPWHHTPQRQNVGRKISPNLWGHCDAGFCAQLVEPRSA
jgi:hypothetical protein